MVYGDLLKRILQKIRIRPTKKTITDHIID